MYLPARLFFITPGIRLAVGYLEAGTTALSRYALVYAGLTGDPFMPSARRARALTVAAETGVGKKRGFSAERRCSVISVGMILILVSIVVLCSGTDAVDGRTADTDLPVRIDDVSVCGAYARGSGSSVGCCDACWGRDSHRWTVLCGLGQGYVGVLFLSIGHVCILICLFVEHSADTLYMCYCIDRGMGQRKREEVFVVVSHLHPFHSVEYC